MTEMLTVGYAIVLSVIITTQIIGFALTLRYPIYRHRRSLFFLSLACRGLIVPYLLVITAMGFRYSVFGLAVGLAASCFVLSDELKRAKHEWAKEQLEAQAEAAADTYRVDTWEDDDDLRAIAAETVADPE